MELPLEFKLHVARHPGGVVVTPEGEIDMSTVDQVRDALRAGREQSAGALLLDLRRVSFLDTSGLRLVAAETERARSSGDRFAVVRGPGHVQRIFAIAGLDRITPLVDDPAAVLGDVPAGG